MIRSPKFLWATCLTAFLLTIFLVMYTTTQQSLSILLRFSFASTPTTNEQIVNNSMNSMRKEKYLTFMPHSGLHNQRIGLINALILAKALDRTLLLPDINIGTGIHWKPTPIADYRLSECSSNKQRTNNRCGDFNKYVPVSVETIFDLSAAHFIGIRTLQRSSMSESYYQNVLGVTDHNVYHIDDNSRSSYRIYDSRGNQDDMRIFSYRVELEDLKERSERVMVFGSLHYTLRIAMQDPKLKWLANYLRQETSISNPIVIKQALSVLPLLGGPGNFVGVHLRQGDGFFKHLMHETFNTLRFTLEQSTMSTSGTSATGTGTSADQQRMKSRPVSEMEQVKLNKLKEINQANPIDKTALLNQCVSWHNQGNHPRLRLIYMATDTRHPRVTLKQLFDEFPCIFTLNDFPMVIERTLSMAPMETGNSQLDEEANTLGSSISSLLIPMIDAEIASHGSTFIGTKKSTFSQYINYRYSRWQSFYRHSHHH